MRQTFVVPGRANLIGEHTDYAGGLALPFALDLAITVSVLEADEGVTVVTDQFGTWRSGEPTALAWQRQAASVIALCRPAPCRIGVSSSIPVGQGLSSSAAFIGALLLACGATGDLWTLARLVHRIEADAGSDVGLLDQLATLGGVAGHALLIDFAASTTSLVTLPPSLGMTLVSSGISRDLATSAYQRRRAECAQAAALVGPLGQLGEGGWSTIADPAQRKRARHVATECARVRQTVSALGREDLSEVGRLLTASHASLRDDFEVSTSTMDALVDECVQQHGVFGARMVGGGFGGCVLVVHDPAVTVATSRAAWRVWAVDGALARLH